MVMLILMVAYVFVDVSGGFGCSRYSSGVSSVVVISEVLSNSITINVALCKTLLSAFSC
jgi:hypothetical protein